MHGPAILVIELFQIAVRAKTNHSKKKTYCEEEKPQAVHQVVADLEEEGILGNPHPDFR